MKALLILKLIIFTSITLHGQNYSSVRFKSSGIIEFPTDWKVYDKEWNDQITREAGYNPSKKITILRASDYDNSTFYLKLSTKQLERSFSKTDISNQDFLDTLNDDLNSLAEIFNKDPKSQFTVNSKATSTTIGNALGGYIQYTYVNQMGAKRRITIYTLINGETFYNLTVSWDENKNENSKKILSEIIKKIKLSE